MTNSVSDDSFEQDVIQADGPVVVDFWAEWCGPCKALSPIVDEVSQEMGDKVRIVKMNIDENPNTPTKFGVRGIPTLMVFKDGQVTETKVGGMSKEQLTGWLSSVV